MDSNKRASSSVTGIRRVVEFKLLTIADVGQFLGLWDEAFSSDPYAFRTTKDRWAQKPINEKVKNFENSILHPNFILGAFYESELIGMVGIRRQEVDFMLWGTFVRSTFRNDNIGFSLVEGVIEKLNLSLLETTNLYLEVFTSALAARSLYNKLGFVELESKSTGEIVAVRSFR